MKWRTVRSLRGLAFDIENKPGTYGGGDYVHPKITAIGCQFLDEKEPHAWCMTRDDPEGMAMAAREFAGIWAKADFVVGHNIRRHDIKILDGFYTSLGLPMLGKVRTVDTYLDQPRMQGFSRSLENLAERWECPVRKMHLSEYDWERAYDGVPEGVELMRKRVISDVRISIWLYWQLVERGLLK